MCCIAGAGGCGGDSLLFRSILIAFLEGSGFKSSKDYSFLEFWCGFMSSCEIIEVFCLENFD